MLSVPVEPVRYSSIDKSTFQFLHSLHRDHIRYSMPQSHLSDRSFSDHQHDRFGM